MKKQILNVLVVFCCIAMFATSQKPEIAEAQVNGERTVRVVINGPGGRVAYWCCRSGGLDCNTAACSDIDVIIQAPD